MIDQKHEEWFAIPFSDTVPKPWAMVIVCAHTPFADLAMLRPQRLIMLALLAVTLLHIEDDLIFIWRRHPLHLGWLLPFQVRYRSRVLGVLDLARSIFFALLLLFLNTLELDVERGILNMFVIVLRREKDFPLIVAALSCGRGHEV